MISIQGETRKTQSIAKNLIGFIDEFRNNPRMVNDIAVSYSKTHSFKETLEEKGYKLNEDELKIAQTYYDIQRSNRTKISEMNLSILDKTLTRAYSTYRNISWMSIIMFSVGTILFLAAGFSAFVSKDLSALVFSASGIVVFASLFFFEPMKKSEQALSDLVQAEIIFQDYQNQEQIWQRVARSKSDRDAPDIDDLKSTSIALHLMATDCMEQCQKYLEGKSTDVEPKIEPTKQGSATTTPGQEAQTQTESIAGTTIAASSSNKAKADDDKNEFLCTCRKIFEQEMMKKGGSGPTAGNNVDKNKEKQTIIQENELINIREKYQYWS
jgi:hypothetical protein